MSVNMFGRPNAVTRSVEETSNVQCPACEEALVDDMDEYELDDTESIVVECGHCGEKIEVEAHIVTCYVAKISD